MNRVLFVDDEPRILSALRRLLYPLRKQWHMVFVDSANAALAKMTEEDFDVIVTDIRMPEMDGAELLYHVRQQYPAVVRLVLSGHCERSTVVRCAAIAHQFLTKPCDSEILRSTVERTCRLQLATASDSLRKTLCGMTALPARREVLESFVQKIKTDDSNLEQLVDQSVALSAKLIQLVSTSFFGTPRSVASGQEAAKLLGREILQALSRQPDVFRANEDPSKEELLQQVDKHVAIARAKLEELTKDKIDGEITKLCSAAIIFHDAGAVILAELYADQYKQLINNATTSSLAEAEHTAFGCTHDQLGAYLAALWGLPDAVVEAISYHECPQQFSSHQDTVALLHFVLAHCPLWDKARTPDVELLHSAIGLEMLETTR